MKLLDSSPIIALLGDLSNPQLISHFITLGYSVYVPRRVIEEVCGEPEKSNLSDLIKNGVIKVLDSGNEVTLKNFRDRYPKLGFGESELIITAQQWIKLNKDFCCIIDDKLARKTAESFGIKCCGTIGLLNELLTRGLISKQEINEFYDILKESGFRYKFISLNKQ